jgi:hypothetical protein
LPAKISFAIKREIKTFHTKQNLKGLMVILPHCRKYLKEYYIQRRRRMKPGKYREKINPIR